MPGEHGGQAVRPPGASTVLAARRRAGLSQEELAERTGLSVRSISNLERGVVDRPRRASLEAIAAALELDPARRADLIDHYRQALDTPRLRDPGRSNDRCGPGQQGGWPGGVTVRPESPARSAGPAACPAQLPAANPSFTGRDAELRHLDDLLVHRDASVGIALIHGAAGVGKSALALHWAHSVRAQFPDGQLYADLSGFGATAPVDPGLLLMNFLRALGVDQGAIPSSSTARAAMFRSLLAGRQILIILDNARNAAQVRPLLPGLPGCLVVVTSRSRIRGLSASHHTVRVALDPFTRIEGTALLMLLVGVARVAGAPAAVVEILDCCAGIPLALAVVAQRISEFPERSLSRFAAELVDVRTRLDRLALPDDDDEAKIRSVLSWSYAALTPESAGVFRMLTAHPGTSFTAPSAAVMLSMPIEQLQSLLDELTGLHLLEHREHARYEYHQLIRLYAAEKAADDCQAARAVALERVRGFFLDCAMRAAAGTFPSGEAASGSQTAATAATTATAATAATAAPASSDELDPAPYSWPDVVHLSSDGQLASSPLHHIDSDADTFDCHPTPHEARGAHELGVLLRGVGGNFDARRCFTRAVRSFQRTGDTRRLAAARVELGLTMLRCGELAEAVEMLRTACDSVAGAGHLESEGYALVSLGNAYRLLGREAEARGCLLRGAALARSATMPTLAVVVESYLDELDAARPPAPLPGRSRADAPAS